MKKAQHNEQDSIQCETKQASKRTPLKRHEETEK